MLQNLKYQLCQNRLLRRWGPLRHYYIHFEAMIYNYMYKEHFIKLYISNNNTLQSLRTKRQGHT